MGKPNNVCFGKSMGERLKVDPDGERCPPQKMLETVGLPVEREVLSVKGAVLECCRVELPAGETEVELKCAIDIMLDDCFNSNVACVCSKCEGAQGWECLGGGGGQCLLCGLECMLQL